MPRPFRFGIQTSNAPTAEAWAEKARRIEELGFSSLFVPDHFGDQLAPIIAMTAAADATSTLRVGGLVLDNDYRHPLMLAKELATLDVLSGGRVEAGIGAGWMLSDYDESGIPFERPGIRIEKLTEALTILKGLFGDEPFSHAGRHYQIEHHSGTPKPVQKPHPPILLGGGGKRVLSLAAREADIVGVNFNLADGVVSPTVAVTGSAEATDEKIGWVRAAAGGRFDEIELNVTVFVTAVTDDRQGTAERIAPGFGLTAEQVLDSPHVLVGSVDEIADDLQQSRERFGFSYVVFSGDVFDVVAPIVKRLAGA